MLFESGLAEKVLQGTVHLGRDSLLNSLPLRPPIAAPAPHIIPSVLAQFIIGKIIVFIEVEVIFKRELLTEYLLVWRVSGAGVKEMQRFRSCLRSARFLMRGASHAYSSC